MFMLKNFSILRSQRNCQVENGINKLIKCRSCSSSSSDGAFKQSMATMAREKTDETTDGDESSALTKNPIVKLDYQSKLFGQPTRMSHPHLLKDGEFVPGVTLNEFRERRKRLMQGIIRFSRNNQKEKKLDRHIVVIPSSTKKFMSDKIPYVFRQNSDFFYLTGCLEPDTVLLLTQNGEKELKSTMFVRPKEKHAELWDGPRTGVDNAIFFFGIDEAYPMDKFQEEFNKQIEFEKACVWYDSRGSDLKNITQIIKDECKRISSVGSPNSFIQSMRLIKSFSEQNLMRQTCRIAADSINDVIHESRPGFTEHQIFALIDYKCRIRNADYLAYPPVVAAGKNSTIIHYIENTQIAKNDELVLMDAGCQYGGYTSDITRTWPINGEFTEPQKILYDIVLQVQKDLLNILSKEGGDTLDNLFDTMCVKLGKYLQEAHLVPKDVNDEIGYARAGYKFCPHHVSHYLGMDVHDTPLMPRSLPLTPGMCFTVEPGIYINVDREDVPQEFRGIGVRIEDDVLLRQDREFEILTSRCCKERSALAKIQHQQIEDHQQQKQAKKN